MADYTDIAHVGRYPKGFRLICLQIWKLFLKALRPGKV